MNQVPSSNIAKLVRQYYGEVMENDHYRYRSWEHCHRFFQSMVRDGTVKEQLDQAALHLGFYLASWGMYRGSSFLLQYTYTIHRQVVENLASSQLSMLWSKDVVAEKPTDDVVTTIIKAIDVVKSSYGNVGTPTDTLATKIILGTIGCLPACDRFFIRGFKECGLPYSYLNANFVTRVTRFCSDHLQTLRVEQSRIEGIGGVHYPLMKLADMYFWQLGYNSAPGSEKADF